ncbi:MAG: efflux RND transporter permease subunit [Microthrixaceae bacterium]
MERFWRAAGVQLGKYWWAVLGSMLVITGVLALGLSQLEFATGQDSYLNQDSQIAVDNVDYQDNFGGEAAILLFQAEGDNDITDLFAGSNLEELRGLEERLREIPEVFAVVAPLTAVQYSEAIVTEGVGTNALLSAAERDPDSEAQAVRQADITTTLGRLGAVEEEDLSNETWVDFLLFSNTGFDSSGEGAPVAPADPDREVRGSLQPSFPNLETAVGGVLIEGNADLDTLSAGTDAILEAVDEANFEGFEVIVTGSPVFLKDINDYLQGGMLTLGAAALAIMAVILLLMFRVRWRLLPLLSVIVGVVWAFAILGLIDIDLSLVTISGLPILIGLGIDFAIQIQNRVEEEVVLDKASHPMSETLANLAPALIVATVAGALAFLALLISQVPMIRDFGVMLAIGVVVLVIVGIVLPTAVLGIREWKSRSADRKESIPERIVVWLGGMRAGAAPFLLIASVLLFVAGVAFESSIEIESDPVKWIDQSSQTVDDVGTLEEATGFSSTLGVLVQANNVLDQDVTDTLFEFSEDAEATEEVVTSSSVENTIAKIINIPGATPLPPTSEDLAAAAEVMPPDVKAALLSDDLTATQVNLRLAPASLEERAELVSRLEADLDERIAALDLPEDSILLTGIEEGQTPVQATPSGLAVVGVGLLENLSANRAILTYLGLPLVALWLLLRFRSPARALLTMIPIGLAVGVSTAIVGLVGITLSPLTTVSGPLVIATCTEFSVLIMARFLEERQRGLEPKEASDQAARRTGRAFFTSALTTIGGFAVLIGSALPLLRDFGIIVTLNVAIALLAALVAMPPILQWADMKGLLDTGEYNPEAAVVLASRPKGARLAVWLVSIVVIAGAAVWLFASADTSTTTSADLEFVSQELPTTTTAAPAAPAEGEAAPGPDGASAIDASTFGTERPSDPLTGLLFDALTAQGATPNEAVCTAETLLTRTTTEELVAQGIASFSEESLAPVVQAAQDCGVDQSVIDATIAAGPPI